MKRFVANPIDSVMHLNGASEHPCHLLVELRSGISKEALTKIVESQQLCRSLASARFKPGGFGFSPRWEVGEDGPIEIRHLTYNGEFESFCPDRELPELSGNFRLTVIDRPDGSCWVVLTWSHTLTDARGGEELLKLIGGCSSKAIIGGLAIDKPDWLKLSRFGRYCATRRKLGARKIERQIVRTFATFDRDKLWSGESSPFFRSATLLAAFIKAINPSQPVLCALPVLQSRRRIFPGNQLGVLHLMIKPIENLKELNNQILSEMEHVVREELPKLSLQGLQVVSRFGKLPLKALSNYPAVGRFADICMSSLGASSIPHSLFGREVTRVRHYPPTFPWGGITLAYYEYGNESTLVLLGPEPRLLDGISGILQHR